MKGGPVTVEHICVVGQSYTRRRNNYPFFPATGKLLVARGGSLRMWNDAYPSDFASKKVLLIDVSDVTKSQFTLPKTIHNIYPDVTDFFLISDKRQVAHLKGLGMSTVKKQNIAFPKIEKTPRTRQRISKTAPVTAGDLATLSNWWRGAMTLEFPHLCAPKNYVSVTSVASLSSETEEEFKKYIAEDRLILLPGQTADCVDHKSPPSSWGDAMCAKLSIDHSLLGSAVSFFHSALRAYGYMTAFTSVAANLTTEQIDARLNAKAKQLKISTTEEQLRKVLSQAQTKAAEKECDTFWSMAVGDRVLHYVLQDHAYASSLKRLLLECAKTLSSADRRLLAGYLSAQWDIEMGHRAWLTAALDPQVKKWCTSNRRLYNLRYPKLNKFQKIEQAFNQIDAEFKERFAIIEALAGARYDSFMHNLLYVLGRGHDVAIEDTVKALVAYHKTNLKGTQK